MTKIDVYFFDLVRWDGENEDEEDRLAEKGHAFLKDLFAQIGIPSERIGWDEYDASVEIYAPGPFRLSEGQQRQLWDLGFIQAYVNHGGPSAWETHYSFGTKNGFKAKNGWRVSYPHKRAVDDRQIWVEERVATWPKNWFGSWWDRLWRRKPYVIIKGQG
jgi:hypothetical protein